jgi:hypothetical protein
MAQGDASSRPGQSVQRSYQSASSQGDVISATKRIVRNHPRKVATVVLWILGIFCMFFAPAPMKITPEMQERYQEKMDKIIDMSGDLLHLNKELDKLGAELYGAKRFGWWFRSKDRETVNEIKSRMAPYEKELKELNDKRYSLESSARNELGLWSEAGIQETRDTFWNTWRRGKRHAQVSILWDLVWELFRSDNYEDSVNFLFRIIYIVVSNAVLFMITSTMVFMFSVISVIRSFQPSLLSGLLFYLVALLAAFSTISALVTLVVGSGVGAGILVAKNARYLPRAGNRRQYVRHQHQRPHQE